MTAVPCPSCQQAAVAVQAPGRAHCGACAAQFFSYPDILPALAAQGFDAAHLRTLIGSQSTQSLADPSTSSALRTIALKGTRLHVSTEGQAIWIDQQAAQIFGMKLQPVPALPEDPMAALGIGSAASARVPMPMSIPSEPGLDIADYARPLAPTLAPTFAEDFVPTSTLAPLPLPAPSAPVSSESGFATSPSRFSGFGRLFRGFIKLSILVAVLGGGWLGFESVRDTFIWPTLDLDYRYQVTLPAQPPPVAQELSTSGGTFYSLSQSAPGKLRFVAMWQSADFGGEELGPRVAREECGAGLEEVGAFAGAATLRSLRMQTNEDAQADAAQARIVLDDEGHIFVLCAVAQDATKVSPSDLNKFFDSFRRLQKRPTPGQEPGEP